MFEFEITVVYPFASQCIPTFHISSFLSQNTKNDCTLWNLIACNCKQSVTSKRSLFKVSKTVNTSLYDVAHQNSIKNPGKGHHASDHLQFDSPGLGECAPDP